MEATVYDRRKAHQAVADALKVGLLAPPSVCAVCGCGPNPAAKGATIIYHHYAGYEPHARLLVVAVCGRDHIRIHRGRVPEPITGIVRQDEWAESRRRAVENTAAWRRRSATLAAAKGAV